MGYPPLANSFVWFLLGTVLSVVFFFAKATARSANAYCERLVGTVRRECLDFMIPLMSASQDYSMV